MTQKELEERLQAVERELATLKRTLKETAHPLPWWERIAGTFQGDPVYKKAMALGKDYRRSLRPDTAKRKEK